MKRNAPASWRSFDDPGTDRRSTARPRDARPDRRRRDAADEPLSDLSAAYGRADDIAASRDHYYPHDVHAEEQPVDVAQLSSDAPSADRLAHDSLCEVLGAIGINCSAVNVSFTGGVVTLRGRVRKQLDSLELEMIAAALPDVTSVDNQIRIVDSPPALEAGIAAAAQRGAASAAPRSPNH